MDKTQEKLFKLLKLLDDCRNKLYATYNLFMSCLVQAKSMRAQLCDIYEQLLDCRDEFVTMQSLSKTKKVSASKQAGILATASKLYGNYQDILAQLGTCMNDCESCRKTYKHEVSLCCSTYNVLKKDGLTKAINKGYKQQVKLIRAILDKIDEIKSSYKAIKAEVAEESERFEQMYASVNKMVQK